MRMMELIKLACEVINAIYPIIKDIRAARQKKADRCANTDQQNKS